MKRKICCLCKQEITAEEPAVLTMTALANPKYVCPDCEDALDRATLAKTTEEIDGAIYEIGERMEAADNDDQLVLKTVTEILGEARERRELIADGIYDFSNDGDAEAEELDEVPEELLETEEDKARDEHDKAIQKKFDKIINWVMLACFVAFLAYVIYRLTVIL